MSDELLRRDATDQLAALAARRVSAVELLKASLARHEKTHKTLNAVVVADLEGALANARAIHEHRAKGDPLGPLAGLPMTVKDTFDVAGMAASSGIRALKARMVGDASAVRRATPAIASPIARTKR